MVFFFSEHVQFVFKLFVASKVAQIVVFTFLYMQLCPHHYDWHGIREEDDVSFVNQLLNRLSYVLMCVTTLGQGDVYPVTKIGKRVLGAHTAFLLFDLALLAM
jgi:hypothetical protein